ncbi:HEPACAM family member 2, partial [Gracilinanus agilis]|uniref:HEPACAM family member 2 n=1 Tax=Gracilinanus agilis TaxID=191870 RepID=UPI001CFD56A0
RPVAASASLTPGGCHALTVSVPSATVHGVRGRALELPVAYSAGGPAAHVQVIWLFQRPRGPPRYLLGSVNRSLVPDLEYRHKFSMTPPNASLRIAALRFSDEGSYVVKVNVHLPGNRTLSAHQKVLVTVDDPVVQPSVQSRPAAGAVEKVGNLTLTCAVAAGTRVRYQWLKDERPVRAGGRLGVSGDGSSLRIAPVSRADVGHFRCLARNAVSAALSEALAPTIY